MTDIPTPNNNLELTPAHVTNLATPLAPPTIEFLVSGQAWDAIPADHQCRFLVGMAQLFATGYGHIITQPIERGQWRFLIEAGYIALDEDDDFVLRVTDFGNILFCTVLGHYLPVTDPQR